MKKVKKIVSLMLATMSLSLVIGCGKTDESQSKVSATKVNSKPVTLTISAAASLKDALGEIKQQYIKDNSNSNSNININITINFNFGSSGALQRQIEQGAAVDLFIFAATKQMDALKSKGLTVDETIVNLLGNNIVLVTSSSSTLSISDFNGLTTDSVKKLALGEPASVPCGEYAEETFTKLGILDKMKAKAVYGNDVKQVLNWVETNNADAGVVYESDAKTSTKVKILATASSDSHKPVIYPAGVLKNSKNTNAAKAFLNYLKSDKTKTIFEKYSFVFLPK